MQSDIHETSKLDELIKKYRPTYIVLDCDGTLYPNILEARKIFSEILFSYLNIKLGYSIEEAIKFIDDNKKKYQTESEIAACILGGINSEEFENEVIELIPLDSMGLMRSSFWISLLKYDLPLIIFTNNSSGFARRICREIGILKNVRFIFGEVELEFLRKPDSNAFKMVSDFIGLNQKVLYFDDDENCIDSGRKCGWSTVRTTFCDIVVDQSKADAVIMI